MKVQRIQAIENLIHEKSSVSLDDLCEQFNVSKNTVRRDIAKLLQKNTIRKVYGGVVSIYNNPEEIRPFENRDTENHLEKQLIGKAAADFIEENDLIFIDSGTTTSCLAAALPTDKEITIITNSLDVINFASEMDNVKLIVIGSTFKPSTKSFVGVENWGFFEKYNITKAFMAATALSTTHGVMNSDILEYEIKRHMIEKATEKFLLVDHTKVDKSALLTYGELAEFDWLVTSKDMAGGCLGYCQDVGVLVRLV
ncbi:DeoR/GlpR transcriptional regulator [Listeria monocytogenes]|uniref:DeoR/GlpR family DNA-binding transcription regulator n=1 Tax=Listeria monocytogenes TaxID=1639 RepID=UPI0010DA7E7C|nr:DeoR/GlpR family DNA-binding transcription regulator [Listeria monocytogenes]EAD4091764.1 DeoR/GlpR transcriptional regulator [Listeria monocytogenes]EAD8947127.1 DeoR/GlpR transcriptional regulator [Listeria monocytogenes]EAF0824570.1 DeoR/GlpR transcriptional regulator [Listeria monocytogenes]EAG1756801.1 DeoR/GlpR transcriptional regulator [Listeria monocytogenes]EBF5179637.1 DeoR/GlpR transcriptional regulator [Listeria monocytogenes]